MKRISDEEIQIEHSKYDHTEYHVTEWDKMIAQAQLEADEKVVREIFEEIGNESFAEPILVPESGREPVIICLSVKEWQALKEKYLGVNQ